MTKEEKLMLRELHLSANADQRAIIERLFPELAESEDERIFKAIAEGMRDAAEVFGWSDFGNVPIDDILAWIEKQGQTFTKKDVDDAYLQGVCDAKQELEKQDEQTPVDNIEPKFKVGDWIVWKGESYKVYYNGYSYELMGQNGLSTSLEYSTVDENAHLWTIKDAKPGDVLVTNDGNIFIYRKHDNNDNNYVYYYYSTNYYDTISLNSSWNTFGIKPATKEQRNILFQKMKEAGYKWDTEKKKLSCIEQKPIQETESFEPEHGKYYYCIKDYFWGGKKQASKGDVIQALRGLPIMALKDASEYFLPVNSIKQKHAWSKEDGSIMSKINRVLNAQEYYDGATGIKMNPYNDALDWLKSLKGRYTWKPSQEQMEALAEALSLAKNCGEESAFDLRTLYEQLKKLRDKE